MALAATCLAPTAAVPLAQLAYSVGGTGQSLARALELPLPVTKFCGAVDVPPAVFTQRWQQVAGPPFKVSRPLAGPPPPRAAIEALLVGMHFRLLPGADGGPGAVAAATVLHCGGGASGAPPRQVPCMVRVEGLGGPGPATVAVATADAAATDALLQRLAALLGA